MKLWERKARSIMKGFLFSEAKINSIIDYANEDPKANSELKLYKAAHKARQCL